MSGISRRAYARTRGVSESVIRRHIASGTLADAILHDDTIDPAKADRLLVESVTRGRSEPVPLRTAKARKARALARQHQDELDELHSTLFHPDDVEYVVTESNRGIIAHLAMLPLAVAPKVAGKSGDLAYALLRDEVNQTLGRIHDELVAQEEPKRIKPDLDLDGLTPVALATLLTSQQAEKLEIERKLAKGQLRHIDDINDEETEKAAVSVSILKSLPNRVASKLESATVEEAVVIIGAEVELVINALGVSYP